MVRGRSHYADLQILTKPQAFVVRRELIYRLSLMSHDIGRRCGQRKQDDRNPSRQPVQWKASKDHREHCGHRGAGHCGPLHPFRQKVAIPRGHVPRKGL